MKKFLSIIFCFALLLSICSVSFTASAEEYKVGDIIEFGNYPQSQVTDEAIIAELNKDTSEWISYGYYAGTGEPDGQMKPSDCMSYKDVNYSGCKYRGVKIDSYRPCSTNYKIDDGSLSNQERNGYTEGNIYWFIYEPIEWRVLDPATGLIMCNSVIDSQPLNNYKLWKDSNQNDEWDDEEFFGDAECSYYSNNYAESSIRQWLNNEFYNFAFTDNQKSDILTTELDNSAYNEKYSEYDSSATSDKIFLLSYSDVLNTDYGFDGQQSYAGDAALELIGTDYANSQGLQKSGTAFSWLLRSPGDTSKSVTTVVDAGYNGNSKFGAGVSDEDNLSEEGIVPAMTLQAIKTDTELNTEIITDINNRESGAEDKTAGTSTESNKVLIICIVGRAIFLILLIIIIILLLKLKNKNNNGPDNGVSSISAEPNSKGRNNFEDAQNYGQQYNKQDQNYYAQSQQMNNQAQPVQNAQVQSPISVAAMNQPGVCRKCGNQVTELYNVSVNKDGQVRRAVLCRECTQNFVTAYNNRNK